MGIVPHTFNDREIDQLSEDTLIGGVMVPKGYVNATQMCKANGKRWVKYTQNSKTEPFLEALSHETGCAIRNNPVDPEKVYGSGKGFQTHPPLVIAIQGGSPEYQGTWVNHKVAMHLAQWLSPQFAAWAAITLSNLIEGNYKALTEEAAIAESKLQEAWLKVRTEGKETRRSLTDAIQDWLARNESSALPHAHYASCTNQIYQALWGMDAIEIESLFNCPRNKSRDYMSAKALRVLERAEDRVIEFIDLDNLHPMKQAVEAAQLRPSRVELVKSND